MMRSNRTATAWAIAVLILAPASSRAAEFCVGSASALQQALFTAAGNGVDNDLRIQSGTITPSSSLLYSPTAAQALVMSGGWNTGCSSQTATPSLTTLTGSDTRRVFGMTSAVAASITLSNLSVTHGFGNNIAGSGLYINTLGDLTLTDVEFRDNVVVGDPTNHRAGAVKIDRAQDIVVLRSRFEANRAPLGAGMAINGCESVRVEDSFFENNEAVFSGSGLIVEPNSAHGRCALVHVEDTTFIDNVGAPLGAAAYGNIALVRLEIRGTTASAQSSSFGQVACGSLRAEPFNGPSGQESGDIDIQGGQFQGTQGLLATCFSLIADNIPLDPSSIRVTEATFSGFTGKVFRDLIAGQCEVTANHVLDNTEGPALDSFCPSLVVRRNTFSGNQARIGAPAALRASAFLDSLVLESNLFVGNTANDVIANGGAIRVNLACGAACTTSTTARVQITNNTFLGNASAGTGGALGIESSFDVGPMLALHNNLFWGNTAVGAGADVYFDNDKDGNFVTTPITVEFNALGVNNGGYATSVASPPPAVPSNFEAVDPVFVDPETQDYRLSSQSPYRDAGSNAAPDLGPTDLLGAPRITGSAVDLGALEAAGAIDPIDTLPVAIDDTGQTKGGATLTGSLAANDIRGEGLNLWTLVTSPSLGTAQVSPDGSYSYTANATAAGIDQFIYRICDVDSDCDEGVMSLSVLSDLPLPVNDAFTMTVGTVRQFSVSTNDRLDEPLQGYSLVGDISPAAAANSVLVSLSGDGQLQVSSDGSSPAPYVGDVAAIYRVCDTDNDCATANVTITIEPASAADRIFANGFEP